MSNKIETIEAVIGLEIHVQVSTNTKLFCGCDNDSFGKAPNTNVCPICMGFPGMLPVPNKVAIEKGLRGALALKCTLKNFSKFDRKNYFYPDLPSGFQISQYDEPISEKGKVEIEMNGETKTVRITRLHLENDAGKLTHVASGSLVDFNRAGTPLMEIVSEPDLRTADEAVEYAKTVQAIMRACGASDADMEKGMMRFDASVSTRPQGEDKLYPRAEIKNLNSFKALEAAIHYEIKRQAKLWEDGTPMEGEVTVGWLDDEQKTKLLRSKETAADYRYFPEPDIPPLTLSDERIAELRADLPELPLAKRRRFIESYGLSEEDARFFSEDSERAAYFERVAQGAQDGKAAAAFVGTVLFGRLNAEGRSLNECRITPEHMIELLELIKKGDISNNTAKTTVFDAMLETGNAPHLIVEREGLKQVSDTGALEALVDDVLAAHPGPAQDFKNGKEQALGFLVGQVMKASKGQANPPMVNDLLRKKLS